MTNIFGRLATILISSLLVFLIAVNIYNMLTQPPITEGYYRYFGFNSLIAALNDFKDILSKSWYSTDEMITTIMNIFNQNLGLFVLSALTWFLPYIAICLVFQIGTFMYVIVNLLIGGYTFVLPKIYFL